MGAGRKGSSQVLPAQADLPSCVFIPHHDYVPHAELEARHTAALTSIHGFDLEMTS